MRVFVTEPQHTQILIDKARVGDEQAFQRLIVLYHPRLRARLLRQMDQTMRAHLDPEDILQQVYLEAFRALSQFAYLGKDSFLRWLFTIMDRKLIDEHRALHAERRDVRRRVSAPPTANEASYVDLIQRLQVATSTPSRVIRTREAVAALQSCLASLPAHYREVIEMRFLQGQSVAEVARHMKRTPGSIHMLCHRALTQLREQFQQLGLGSEG
jgi:RNA polymerase sigma-70 factor (ECF subfamily)